MSMLRGSKYSRSLLGKVLDLAILAAFASGNQSAASQLFFAESIRLIRDAFVRGLQGILRDGKLLGGAAQVAREIVIAVLEQAAGSLRGEHAGWSSLWRNAISLIIWSGRISRHATNAMMSAIAAILPFVSISKSKVNGFTRSERPILDH